MNGMTSAGLLIKSPQPRLSKSVVVKMNEIAGNAKAAENIGKQLNMGVTGIMFVSVESAEEAQARHRRDALQVEGRHALGGRRQRAGVLGHEREGIQGKGRPVAAQSERRAGQLDDHREQGRPRRTSARSPRSRASACCGRAPARCAACSRRSSPTARASSMKRRGKRRFRRCWRPARNSTCACGYPAIAQRHRDAHEAGLQRVRDELGRSRIQGDRDRQEGGGAIRASLVLVLALICGAGCNSTPSAPTPVAPAPPVAEPPGITCPASITVTALTSAGPAVTYATPEIRNGQGSVSVACTPPTGTTFPVGATEVQCVATDALNRTGSCTFSVTVAAPPRLSRTRIMAFGDSLTAGATVMSNSQYLRRRRLPADRVSDRAVAIAVGTLHRSNHHGVQSRPRRRGVVAGVGAVHRHVRRRQSGCGRPARGLQRLPQGGVRRDRYREHRAWDQGAGRRGAPSRRARLHLHALARQAGAGPDSDVRAPRHQRSTPHDCAPAKARRWSTCTAPCCQR